MQFCKDPIWKLCTGRRLTLSTSPRNMFLVSELLFLCHRGLVLGCSGDSGWRSHAWGQDRPHLRLRPRFRAHLCIWGIQEQEVVQRRSHSGHTELEVDHGGGECLFVFNFLMPPPPHPLIVLSRPLQAKGKVPPLSYHSCSMFRGELFVLGGVFPRPNPEPDSCSSSLHIFDPHLSIWYQPIVTGKSPSPRSG